MDPLREVLQEFGLSESRTAIYLFLLKFGENSASVIAKNTFLDRTHTYAVLKDMLKKGIVNEIEKRKILYYSATNPQVIIARFREKQRELFQKIHVVQEELKQIVSSRQNCAFEPKARYYPKIEGVNVILEDILVSRPKELLSFLSKDFYAYFDTYDQNYPTRRAQQGILAKGLYPMAIVKDHHQKEDAETKRESRYLPEIFDLGIGILIYNNKVALISIQEEFGLLIESTFITKAQTKLFNFVWAWAKKEPVRTTL